jgi:acyl-CoA synthetase (AMP-forming)/AMP-acid ligase II
VLLVQEAMLDLLPPDLATRWRARSWESVADSGRIDATPPGDDEVAFIQYSSGSTSTPKGCALTTRAIETQLDMLMETAVAPSEIDLVWLPLSHDMGMFGHLVMCWANPHTLYLSTPERFAMSPRSWFRDLAEFGVTFTCATNTALAVAARAHSGRRAGRLNGELKLDVLLLGAERVEWGTLQAALDTFGPYGLRPETIMPAYGLAEATLAVTHTPRGEGPSSVCVDGIGLADGLVREIAEDEPSATRIVSAGAPLNGVELRGLQEHELSEIRIVSPSLAEGYYADPLQTAERFVDGELCTRDLGFVRDGLLYPVGRVDDVISIGGRKVYAREIEAAVDALEGVRRGCSTVVDTYDGGGQCLTLLVEVRDGDGNGDARRLAEAAAEIAMAKAAVVLDRCVFVEGGTLPKTPSGKIQRYRCRQLLEGDRLALVADVEVAGVA